MSRFELINIKGVVDSGNSSATPLVGDAVFPGVAFEILNYGIYFVSVYSDVASATDGLSIQQSHDGTNWDHTDDYTVPAGRGKNYSINPFAKWVKVVYTNGPDDQSIFRIQAVGKGNSKPSSHRIQDPIVDEDDSELVKSVLSGQSALTSIFENVSTYRKALNVNSAWVHRKIVNETFHQHNGTTNLNSAATAGDISIIVDDTAGFAVDDQIKLEETVAGVGVQEIGLMTITIVAAGTPGTLTLDRPLGFDYTIAAVVSKVISNMAVSGTLASPEIFEVDPPPGTVWQFTRIMHSITDQTAMDDAKFGGVAALTNGVCLRATTEAGRTVVFANWKSNYDMKLDMFDVPYSPKSPSGYFGLNGRWTFTKSEVVAELNGDADPIQKLEVLIQDDLTELDTFFMRGQGRVFSP